jgi:hypothetical protein
MRTMRSLVVLFVSRSLASSDHVQTVSRRRSTVAKLGQTNQSRTSERPKMSDLQGLFAYANRHFKILKSNRILMMPIV